MIDENGSGAESANGNNAVSGAPSVDEMIGASFAESGNGARDTSLDQAFTIKFEDTATSNVGSEPAITVDDAPPKRGRPKGSGKAEPAKKKAELARELEQTKAELEALRARNDSAKIDNLANQIEMACFLVFGVAARKRGPHWKLTQEEGEAIGKTGALAMAPYADKFEKEAPWVMFALALGGAVYQRVERDKELVAALPSQTTGIDNV